MADIEVIELKREHDLRKVWPKEDIHFTKWLMEHINLLGKAVGIEDIVVDESESKAGNFRVDICAHEKKSGKKIIIENQLTDTDHDHLGKLITYASNKNADYVIWVVESAYPEHIDAIHWLNLHVKYKVRFYLCEVNLFSQDDSTFGAAFNVLASPDNAYSPLFHDFWEAFHSYALSNPEFKKYFNDPKISSSNKMTYFSDDRSNNISIKLNNLADIRVSLFPSVNQKQFEIILSKAKESLPGNISYGANPYRISYDSTDIFYLENSNKWKEYFDWICDVMIKMKRIITKSLQD